ncbi:unnamed protein product [Darwinula stevensoni]|uniref:Uncharacterized protein n=1 Tax=Darwinula stevensoni TaxID=69355 RepID=A0A7R9A2D6_9CRUS|nr:unnamed protein product [Darwinula stevensoni]CAG0879692.1 unnamed protein product [Darwinula stevensoni]
MYMCYLAMVTMFFVANVANNYALRFNLSVPLFLIFRSGSLLTNMILGIIIRKRRYTVNKYISVAMVTGGVFMCTFASGHYIANDIEQSAGATPVDFASWLTDGHASTGGNFNRKSEDRRGCRERETLHASGIGVPSENSTKTRFGGGTTRHMRCN